MDLKLRLKTVSNYLTHNKSSSAADIIGEISFFLNYDQEMISLKRLEYLIEQASSDSNYSLVYGSLGVANLLRDLVKTSYLGEEEIQNLATDVDPVITKAIDADLVTKNYDLLRGMITKGIYFLNANDFSSVEKILDYLDQIKTFHQDQYVWADYINKAYRPNEPITYNLGMAHGMPAIISFIAVCYKKNIKRELCGNLLSKSVPFLLDQAGTAKAPFKFPSTIKCETMKPSESSRLAWCYGDLGVALSLWHSGVALGNELFKNEALEIMHHAAKISIAESGVYYSPTYQVFDPGICHGTSGIALIFLRFYQSTNVPVFLERAGYWLSYTLEQFDRTEILFPVDFTKDIWKPAYGLLEGLSGVGLVLQSFENRDKYRHWDNIFLTNIAE